MIISQSTKALLLIFMIALVLIAIVRRESAYGKLTTVKEVNTQASLLKTSSTLEMTTQKVKINSLSVSDVSREKRNISTLKKLMEFLV